MRQQRVDTLLQIVFNQRLTHLKTVGVEIHLDFPLDDFFPEFGSVHEVITIPRHLSLYLRVPLVLSSTFSYDALFLSSYLLRYVTQQIRQDNRLVVLLRPDVWSVGLTGGINQTLRRPDGNRVV
jgi:hypothetical protein